MLLALRRAAQSRGCAMLWYGASGRLADLASLYGIDGLLAPRLANDHQRL